MRDAEPSAIYLKDYQVPSHLIDKTHLHFILHPTKTRVSSDLTIRKNPDADTKSNELILHGQDIDLQSVSIDGRQLDDRDYQLEAECLRIANVPEQFVLSVVGLIAPADNTSLEGLYKSQSMYCTQCEAEGFRKITYFLDRPDVLSEFTTTVVADKTEFPVLLSNGNPIKSGSLDDNMHFVTWHDPFPKPAYLFALVGGDLECIQDSFTTTSGRAIDLKIYVEEKDLDKCDHAMASLKSSMRWDEDVYGREYDLDIFMIVAVDDFNMGAMENKGLNIFNTSCVLAKAETTTDAGFQRVEAVVAHEYFHNWSGNRVTCRDWFQLSLKEGFTVFRDAEFSADMGSRTVKRVEDAKLLRAMQFAEDAGPLAHPVQPASFIEISNFYTLTVYEKGAEVVRMIHTLLGAEAFRQGSDLYFERNDGKAATIEDFVSSMEEAGGRDLSKFMSWYHQAGTPKLAVTADYNSSSREYALTFNQTCPTTPECDSEDKKPYLIPVAMGLLGSNGPLSLVPETDVDFSLSKNDTHCVLELTQPQHRVVFKDINAPPVPSLMRGFSAPVRLQFDYSPDDLITLMTQDDDGFTRWDACQQLCVSVIHEVEASLQQGKEPSVDSRLSDAARALITNQNLDPAMVALMLTLPSEGYLAEIATTANIDTIHSAREIVRNHLAASLKTEFAERFDSLPYFPEYEANAVQIAVRSLKNCCLGYLVATADAVWLERAMTQYRTATNMTDQSAALSVLALSPDSKAVDYSVSALSEFYQQWQSEALVVNQWFSVQAMQPGEEAVDRIRSLMQHEAFNINNPNKVRALIGAFANNNPVCFHNSDGSGYRLLAEVVKKLNATNPQIAARMLGPLTKWRKYDSKRQELMQAELNSIKQTVGLSKDVFEVISKSLA
ncbi:aminopeptidase N [Halioxenophilus aromaticivorans]|uniref:Aminopeptidase N n=1 Tax=Halioxenophilus aromaticivorans TaxID=1306992 RepID=A0AAV3TWG4_9ALTE